MTEPAATVRPKLSWRRSAGLTTICALLSVASGCTPSTEAAGVDALHTDLERVPLAAAVDTSQQLNAAFLIVDGVFNSELVAPMDVLHHTPFHTKPLPGIRVFTVSPEGKEVTSFEGLRIRPDFSFDTAPERIDILIVPSAEHSMDSDLDNTEMIEWVTRVGGQAHFVLSLCDGAFVLAKAGLLQERAATTFPGDQDRFAQTFPEIDLRRGYSFVHDGRLLTSEGGAKSYDVAMYLVDHLYGEAATRGVGGGLLIDWPPAPGTMPMMVSGP